MILLLKCPKCGNKMKYQGQNMILIGKRKRCVYCGKWFKVRDRIVEKV